MRPRPYRSSTLLAALAASLFATLFGGCKTTELVSSRPRLAQAAVSYGTIKAIGGDAERAERVIAIVAEAREAVQGEVSLTVAALMAGARSQIRWEKLDAADTVLVEILLAEVEAQLADRLGDGLLSPERRVSVGAVLGWVEDAARLTLRPGSAHLSTAPFRHLHGPMAPLGVLPGGRLPPGFWPSPARAPSNPFAS